MCVAATGRSPVSRNHEKHLSKKLGMSRPSQHFRVESLELSVLSDALFLTTPLNCDNLIEYRLSKR